jgi:hypothetical protein
MRGGIVLTEGNIRSFWKRVPTRDPEVCWLWTGATNDGYGLITLRPGQTRYASHVALVLDGRPRPKPPNDLALHGDCSNPLCVNPSHLRWGSLAQNTADMVRLKRSNPLKGERHFAAKLTDAIVMDIRTSGKRGVDLAREYGVTTSLVSMVRHRKVWAHI